MSMISPSGASPNPLSSLPSGESKPKGNGLISPGESKPSGESKPMTLFPLGGGRAKGGLISQLYAERWLELEKDMKQKWRIEEQKLLEAQKEAQKEAKPPGSLDL